MPSVEELESQLAAARANSNQTNVATVRESDPFAGSGPKTEKINPYAVTSWGSIEYDFTVPSGQTCRMRKLRPETMIGAGILDKITRLPGFAQEAIDKAEGARPAGVGTMPSTEDMRQLLVVLAEIIPLVVVQPPVHPDPADGEEREPGVVYISDIELADRIAIMERATSGISKFDNFREGS
jgi:hypothetical protein